MLSQKTERIWLKMRRNWHARRHRSPLQPKYAAWLTSNQPGQTRRQKNNKFIEIIIADTGISIAAEHLPHIFDRFYRVDKSRTTSGSGLGLAIALRIAHLHGGTIEVESNVGEGARFTVQLG